ncbi:MAG: UDP-N-acetylglucosamine 4,6-dehydratase (inverting), partial [Alteromonas sp.]|nr:UDP-N-acetylglucosamine 4,6-dehydratase (inverting) [Alteromonas sp.]
KFFHRSNDYTSNALNEQGKSVDSGFEYVSDTNEHFLSIEEIKQFNEEAQ